MASVKIDHGLNGIKDIFISVPDLILQPHVWPWLIMTLSVLLGVGSALITWHILQRRQAQQLQDSRSSSSTQWHSLTAEQVLIKLASSTLGLDPAEVRSRQQRFGLNRLPKAKPRHVLLLLLAQFHNLLIYVLLITASITLYLGHTLDGIVIFGVVIINALIGFIQEGKAEDALRAISKMLSLQATVIRQNIQKSIPAEQLVPGDIVVLQSGDKVPADLRLIDCKNLHVQEAILTGESVPVEKRTDPIMPDAVLGDRFSMAYSGTLITSGQATGVVVATGLSTEIGLISALVAKVEKLTTPLLKQLTQFGRWLTIAILVLAIATFMFGYCYRGYAWPDMFLAAVSLAVAAIPEGLPAIMTITLAIGVQRMAKRHAIIRRLPAVETLGSVTVICTDKTGTLTRNEMMVRSVSTCDGSFGISGAGYHPNGKIQHQQRNIDPGDYPILKQLARAALLCNDALIQEQNGTWVLQGDPTEGALLTMAMKAGLDIDTEREKWQRTDVIPFDSRYRFMATLHHDDAGNGIIFVKGAPEKILELCAKQRCNDADTPLKYNDWVQQMQSMARQGQRLLAIACKTPDTDQRTLTQENLETGLTLLGIIGMIDPPRKEAIDAVAQCQKAGIQVKMITGDHSDTAAAIAVQLGLPGQSSVLTGHEIDTLSDQELKKIASDINIFARSSPEHKLRLVEALQANGHVVAMTGDGVNDAPALKRADIGTAMGKKGTEAAKEASEMVLTDDNFATLTHAIEEGRTVYDNLKKSILFILPTSMGEALIIISAIMIGEKLPITPVQILWINMITTVTLALTLSFEPTEADVMHRPPRNPEEPLLSKLLVWRIIFVSLIMVIGTFGLYLWARLHQPNIDYARTVAVNTLVMFEIFYLFNSRQIEASIIDRKVFFSNRFVFLAIFILLVFQLGFTYQPMMQQLFHTVAIEPRQWLLIVLTAFLILPLVEIEKFCIRTFKRTLT